MTAEILIKWLSKLPSKIQKNPVKVQIVKNGSIGLEATIEISSIDIGGICLDKNNSNALIQPEDILTITEDTRTNTIHQCDESKQVEAMMYYSEKFKRWFIESGIGGRMLCRFCPYCGMELESYSKTINKLKKITSAK